MCRVLLVDDNTELLIINKHFLKLLGCEVTTSNDPRAALETLQTASFDLIFIDLRMPYMNGVTFYRRARAICPESRFVFTSVSLDPVKEFQVPVDEAAACMFGGYFRLQDFKRVLASVIARI